VADEYPLTAAEFARKHGLNEFRVRQIIRRRDLMPIHGYRQHYRIYADDERDLLGHPEIRQAKG
jgi:hypothetical protein